MDAGESSPSTATARSPLTNYTARRTFAPGGTITVPHKVRTWTAPRRCDVCIRTDLPSEWEIRLEDAREAFYACQYHARPYVLASAEVQP